MKKLSFNFKLKTLQLSVYVMSIVGLILFFNPTMLVVSLFLSYFLWILGGTIGLHKFCAHKSFKAKNKFIENTLIAMANLCGLGSTIAWCETHRLHHPTSDTKNDPHSPRKKTLQVWFDFFPKYRAKPSRVKDLINDSRHKWYHRNYFRLIWGIIAVGFLAFGSTFLYFYILPLLFLLVGRGIITVTEHAVLPGKLLGYRNYNTTDFSYNSKLLRWLVPGEGYHNNHHANPGHWNTAVTDDEYDICASIIKLIGDVKERPHKPIDGKISVKDFDESQIVSELGRG